MHWLMLIIAGLFEVGFAACLGKANKSVGNEAFYWYAGFLFCLCVSMILLVKVTQHLPIGTAYAVWTGIGAVGTVILSIFVFKEVVTFWKVFFLFTLISSIIGLKYVSN